MKVNILETHDRLLEFKKQGDYISQGCEDCIKNRPEEFGNLPFYIFAHKREIGQDERFSIWASNLDKYKSLFDVPTHRFIWMPRLTKPIPQTNSMLFKYYPEDQSLHIKWMIPQEELWQQYEKGKMTEQSIVQWSIHMYKNKREELGWDDDDDLPLTKVHQIRKEIGRNKAARDSKQVSLVES